MVLAPPPARCPVHASSTTCSSSPTSLSLSLPSLSCSQQQGDGPWGVLGPRGRTCCLHNPRCSSGPELQKQNLSLNDGVTISVLTCEPIVLVLSTSGLRASCPPNHTTFVLLPPNPKALCLTSLHKMHQGPRRTTNGLSPQADSATCCHPSGCITCSALPPTPLTAEPPTVACRQHAVCHAHRTLLRLSWAQNLAPSSLTQDRCPHSFHLSLEQMLPKGLPKVWPPARARSSWSFCIIANNKCSKG